MDKKEQLSFDNWWYENRKRLFSIYIENPDFNIAIMDISEAAWEGALNAETTKEIEQETEKTEI